MLLYSSRANQLVEADPHCQAHGTSKFLLYERELSVCIYPKRHNNILPAGREGWMCELSLIIFIPSVILVPTSIASSVLCVTHAYQRGHEPATPPNVRAFRYHCRGANKLLFGILRTT